MVFQYTSVQTHSDFSNDKGRIKTTKVTIHGKKGTKSVTIKTKSKNKKYNVKRSTKKLTSKEIKCIKQCKFIPGLFNECIDCINNS